jgi:hypothetical protein
MPLTHLEVLVEERSMEAALELLLPKLIGETSFHIHPYRGRDALLVRLPGRLKSYHGMLQPDWLILVLINRDDDDCHALKAALEREAATAGLMTRTGGAGGQYDVLNRIVIEELEAWYFGDWQVVRQAYPRMPPTIPAQARYRRPDAIKGGTWEAFERVMWGAGYFADGLNKRQAAQDIARHMDPARNTSRSFQVFRDALLEAVG